MTSIILATWWYNCHHWWALHELICAIFICIHLNSVISFIKKLCSIMLHFCIWYVQLHSVYEIKVMVMINRSTIHTFKSYMQLFEKMNTINYVISFTGVVRATMDIFSSDASWIVETEGNITEKTDATHSTGSHVFSNRHHFRFKYSFADDAELSVSSNCGCCARSSSTCRSCPSIQT